MSCCIEVDKIRVTDHTVSAYYPVWGDVKTAKAHGGKRLMTLTLFSAVTGDREFLMSHPQKTLRLCSPI